MNRADSVNTPGRSKSGDRFIPNRGAMDMKVSQFNLSKENETPSAESASPSKKQFQDTLAESMFSAPVDSCKILALKAKAPEPRSGYENRLRVLYSQNHVPAAGAKPISTRHIPTTAERILDAPDLVDDYYLNLLDWSKDNMLAVALGTAVYIWNADSGDVVPLVDLETTNVTSVQWAQQGQYIAIGTDNCEVQLWDITRQKQVRSMNGHSARVGALAWNNHILSSASRDSTIINHDVRQQHHQVSSLRGHHQEVCGLAWSLDGTQLASGGNDNLLNVWESSDLTKPRFTMTEHTAAVKALSWCPFQANTLASGGGTADGCIRFWNTQTGACLNSINTGSQVCALQWSRQYKEIVSSHGFPRNQINVWKYPSMVKVAELSGHDSRVLHLAQSPDGVTLVSAAGDETLRFWKVWQPSEAAKSSVKSNTVKAPIGARAPMASSLTKIR